jgi:hypothetical protein
MEIVMIVVECLRRWAQRAGPYLLIEAMLPGGTVLAFLFYLYRRRTTYGTAHTPGEILGMVRDADNFGGPNARLAQSSQRGFHGGERRRRL